MEIRIFFAARIRLNIARKLKKYIARELQLIMTHDVNSFNNLKMKINLIERIYLKSALTLTKVRTSSYAIFSRERKRERKNLFVCARDRMCN